MAAPLPHVFDPSIPTWPMPVIRATLPLRSGYVGNEVGVSLTAGLGRAILYSVDQCMFFYC